ncbi:hypothetical protein KC356_g5390 [Hortaea werneckii]|nr:hypothetical protein KC356_g5390 [Hortaea werneckii]
MKISQSVFWLLAFVTTIHALALPASFDDFASSARELYKRKGGGGGGGRGGGGISSGGRGSSSSSGSRGSSGGGGRVAGSGIKPTYGGGRYYGGGAVTPYRSGSRTPGGIAPYVLAGGALAFFPGVWLYGAYAYAYPHYYTYRNETTGNNETHPVRCLCSRYAECGCEDRNETDYINSIANNQSVSRVLEQNGTETLFINGTLPNGTEETATSAAPAFKQSLAEMSGLWVVVAGVVYTMWFM